MTKKIQLKGRVIFQFEIKAETGLHIGGSDAGVEIGGVNNTLLRNPWDNMPYIPGSSLKGKMRSLIEKYKGLPQNQRIGQGYIHSCEEKSEYKNCSVCQAFGLPGESKFATPTRLVVRDSYLSEASKKKLENANTDLPYTEVKTEVSIDRVTAQANPRTIERVPAGAVFGDDAKPAEIVYSLYEGEGCDLAQDIDRLQTVIEGFALLEDDYLGGSGSRGSGKVKIKNIQVLLRADYSNAEPLKLSPEKGYASVSDLASALKNLKEKITAETQKERH